MNSDPTTETTIYTTSKYDWRFESLHEGAHSLILLKSHCGAAAMRKDAGLTPTRATETTIYTTHKSIWLANHVVSYESAVW